MFISQQLIYILLELCIILIILIIYKPSTLIISPQTFSTQLGASTLLFCLSQCTIPLLYPFITYFGVKRSYQKEVLMKQNRNWSGQGDYQNQIILIYKLRNYTITTQYLQEVWNRRRVVYYTILLIIISGELLGEINYIIVRFPEYDIVIYRAQ